MRDYPGSAIRNIAVTGHSHCGKTTLISALLATAGATDFGATPTAYDDEEIARHMTISNAVAWCEWGSCKINFVDTPGFSMFVHEAKAAMVPVESTLIVVDAVAGAESMTQRVWSYAEEFNMPRSLLINGMNRPRANGEEALAGLQRAFGRQVTALQLPIGQEQGFRGVIDLVSMKAYVYAPDGNGRGSIEDIPADMADAAQLAHEALVELVAEGKDELMEEFFREGTIPEQHLVAALHEAIREDRIFPVLYAAAATNTGTDHLLDFFCTYMPAASEREPVAGRSSQQGGEMVLRPVDDNQPLSLYVFKTISDPFAGHISFFKIFSGCLRNDVTVTNFSRGATEKLTHIGIMEGKTPSEVPVLHAGDIGAVPKLRITQTGDSLGDKSGPIFFEPAQLPEPAMVFAIEPKSRADEDKLSTGLHKLMEEDMLVRFYRDPQTGEFLIAGAGHQHIEVVVSKLRKRYHTEVTLKSPKVPYRETIRARAEGHGRHKKQSGGHGQFGDCKIKIEPLPRGSGFEFENDIFGGSIPRNFIPAVQKGIEETAARGHLAGYPMVDFKVTLFDGSYHDVDSNELSFKVAGRLAFRECMQGAKPVLLEPIMNVEVVAPEPFAGALIADINQRRGRVQGMDRTANGSSQVKAQVPMAEMLNYAADLNSMTQGQGSFQMEMDHYDPVPAQQQEKIIAASKASGKAAVAEED